MSEQTPETTVTLSAPVMVDGEEVSRISLRGPKAGELRGVRLTQMDTDALMKLLPRITQPPLSGAQLSGLKLSDFFALAAPAVGFLMPSDQFRQLRETL